MYACPVEAIIRRVLHLWQHGAAPDTPLAYYYENGRCRVVSAANITDAIKTSVTFLGPGIGIVASDVTARSLRAGGAMALLCAQVDTNIIRLLGRWQSDVMLRYLHLQAQPVMRDFARRMLHGGDYNLFPGQTVPAA